MSRGPENKGKNDPAASVEPWPGALQIDVIVNGCTGLHARPAAQVASIAAGFSSEVRIVHGTRSADGKILAALLRLGAEKGAVLRVEARGPDAGMLLIALRAALENSPNEGEDAAGCSSERMDPWMPPDTATSIIRGTPAAPGMAIGIIFHYRPEVFAAQDTSGDPAVERRRLDEVLAAADAELQHLREEVRTCPMSAHEEIFEVHQALLLDPELLSDVVALINEGHSAPWAWQQVIVRRVDDVRHLKNQRIACRATDLLDIGQRVLRLFSGRKKREPELPPGKCILVANDLTPSDTTRLDPAKIIGLCTASGGPTSHTAIIARARGLPAVVAADDEVLTLPDGTVVILDGSGGGLYPNPDESTLASAKAYQAGLARRQALADADRFKPAVLTDGHRVEIGANIGEVGEVDAAVNAGAEGVGLLRTEFLFLCRETAPSEEDQFLAYREVLRALGGLPLIIRTFDIGGDKAAPYLDLAPEANPFLGVRGIRLCLRRPDVFKTQLRAIYRAASTAPAGSVKIMFPMIARLEDLREARAMAEAVRAEMDAPVCDLGITVEVPSAVMLARELARESDFLSIGTNDLTQYALAIDREHPELGKEADSLHPAVLRLIDQTVRASTAEGKWVGVCGGAASEPLGAMILTGLGVTELSISVPALASVKACLRGCSLSGLTSLAGRALACSTAAEVRALL